MRVDWKPGTMIYPLPAVMVSCGNKESEYNIITVAWTGTICTKPAHVLYIHTSGAPLLLHNKEKHGICD